MARVLIVGCGQRGLGLANTLIASGHIVRGTTRNEKSLQALRAAGVEPVQADPDRVATLMPALPGVAVVCWLMGTASGTEQQLLALQRDRLRMFAEKLVDTNVRGLVVETAGTIGSAALTAGQTVTETAHATWRIPIRLISSHPIAEPGDWQTEASAAVSGLLSPS